eukprot:COSAG02_NODE_30355_length_552_cov_4.715232_1_plen_81_part_00
MNRMYYRTAVLNVGSYSYNMNIGARLYGSPGYGSPHSIKREVSQYWNYGDLCHTHSLRTLHFDLVAQSGRRTQYRNRTNK